MADDSVVKLKIDGKEYTVDMDDLELAEVGTIEDLCGRSAEDINWESARGMQGLVWIVMHRENERFSIEDAGRIKFSSFGDVAEATNGDRPTEGAAKRARAKSGASASGKAST